MMGETRFLIKSGVPFQGSPIYRRSEYSFDFVPESRAGLREITSDEGVTSVLIGMLQIEVSVRDGAALHVWGYHPELSWQAHPLSPPQGRAGAVIVVNDPPFISGVSIRLTDRGEWVTFLDEVSGWVRVTADLDINDEQVILIATDTCLGLIGDQLHSIWVRPTFEP